MHRVFTTLSLIVATAFAAPALAADIPMAAPAKAPAYVPVGYSWTGPYIGINGGYGWGRSEWDGFGSGDVQPMAGWSD